MRALVCLAVLAATTAVRDAGEATALEMPEALTRFLSDGRWDQTPGGFRIIALSHVADGCAGQAQAHASRAPAAKACVERTLALAWKTMPVKSLEGVHDGLWLSHFNLILADVETVTGACPNAKVHTAVSQRLVAMSLADGHAHAPSYAAVTVRWPADQSVTLASLARFDRAHQAHLRVVPVERWRAVVAKGPGLPVSEITGEMATSKYPRGCANAFVTRYGAEFAPDLASAWWLEFREKWVRRAGPFIGFREWPPGVERGGDVDSGPIVMGIGTAASALAIASARAQGDEAFAVELEVSAAQVKALGVAGGVSMPLLADAIAFESHWQPRSVK